MKYIYIPHNNILLKIGLQNITNNKDLVHVKCEEAGVDQVFLVEDLYGLLKDIPFLYDTEKGEYDIKK